MKYRIFLSLSIFFFSLSTFSYRAAALSFLFLAIPLILKKKEVKLTASKKTSIACISTTAFILLVSAPNEINALYAIKFTAMIFYSWLLCTLIFSGILKNPMLCSAAKFFIYAHSLFFTLQLVFYMATGSFIDFNNMVREEESRVLWSSQALHGFIIPIRATGLFSEPSFYSMTVLPIALILAIHEKKISPPVIIGFATCILSLSMAALIISLISILLIIALSKKSKILNAVIALIVITSSPALYGVFSNRIFESADYDAVASRIMIFEEFKQRGLVKNIFGSGFLWDEDKPIGATGLKGYHTRDSSFFINIIFSSGFIGLLASLSFLLFIFRKKIRYLAALLVILLFKLSILHAVLWLTLAMAYSLSKNQKKETTHIPA